MGRKEAELPIGWGAAAAWGSIGALTGTGAFLAIESHNYTPDQTKMARAVDLDLAAKELKNISINPQNAEGSIGSSLQISGNEGDIDDQLRQSLIQIEHGPPTLSQGDVDNLSAISTQITIQSQAILFEERDPYDAPGGMSFLFALLVLSMWASGKTWMSKQG